MSNPRDTRGSTAEMSIAPEVSSDTTYPASHSLCNRPMQSFWDSGSPPVTQTWRTPWLATSARMSSISRHWPPWKEIGREHVCTPVTTAHLVCRLLLVKKKNKQDKI